MTQKGSSWPNLGTSHECRKSNGDMYALTDLNRITCVRNNTWFGFVFNYYRTVFNYRIDARYQVKKCDSTPNRFYDELNLHLFIIERWISFWVRPMLHDHNPTIYIISLVYITCTLEYKKQCTHIIRMGITTETIYPMVPPSPYGRTSMWPYSTDATVTNFTIILAKLYLKLKRIRMS